MKNIVVLTGSFNPITKAHRLILEEGINKVNADFGLLVTTNDCYLTKKNIVDSKTPTSFHLDEKIRKEMIESLTKSFPKVKYGGIELGKESPSTLRTLVSISKKYKDYKLFYMIGADKLHGVSHWTNFDKLFQNFGLIVFPRDGFDISSIINNDPYLSTHKSSVVVMDKVSDTSGVSSSLIRSKFFANENYEDLMDSGPYNILSQYSPKDFPPPTDEEIIEATIKYGGRFGGNAARIKVFKDNKNIFLKWDFSIFGDKSSLLNNTRVYKEKIILSPNDKKYKTVFDSVNQDIVDVAESLIKDNYYPAILNLANTFFPCGEYHKGRNAQEESLAYMSTLSVSLYQFGLTKYKCIRDYKLPNYYPDVYPMEINYGGIYSPNVTFFRNNLDKYYSFRKDIFKCGVISVSSLSNNELIIDERKYFNSDGTLNKNGKEIETNKIRTILRIALSNNHDSIVLAPFGSQKNNLLPSEISSLFHDVLNEEEFKNRFKKVIFAIFEGKGSKRKIVGENGKYKSYYNLFKK